MPTKLHGAPVVRNLVSTDAVFTVAEVAKLLKVSVAKVYTMVDRGELEHFRIGTVLRVRREALEALMTRGRQ
jgi:excisionase family DNA binding protein